MTFYNHPFYGVVDMACCTTSPPTSYASYGLIGKCDYCGRVQEYDVSGGCVSCGAPRVAGRVRKPFAVVFPSDK